MKKFGWTYDELLSTPFHVVLYLSFIDSSIQTHDKLQTLKKEEKEGLNKNGRQRKNST